MTTVAQIPLDIKARAIWVRHELMQRGVTLISISKELDLKGNQASTALRKPYLKLEQAIAKKLGLKAPDIWPERYVNGVHISIINNAGKHTSQSSTKAA